MSGYWSDESHEAHEMQCELEGERGDEWFEGETKKMRIEFYAESLGKMLPMISTLRDCFPFATVCLDFETDDDYSVKITGVSCEFARDIAQAVAEGIVLSDWTAEKAKELLDRETIEHARRYL